MAALARHGAHRSPVPDRGRGSPGDLGRFAQQSDWVLGHRPHRRHARAIETGSGNDYAVMLHARTQRRRFTIPWSTCRKRAPDGTWLEVRDDRIVLGPDDLQPRGPRGAGRVCRRSPPDRPRERRRIPGQRLPGSRGASGRGRSAPPGSTGVLGSETGGSLYPLMASGYLGGALFHTPNVYDFPVCMHVARGARRRRGTGRAMAGLSTSAARGATSAPASFRLPGIVACAIDRRVMATLVDVARDWSTERYAAVGR